MRKNHGSTDVSLYFRLVLAVDGTKATGLTVTTLDVVYTRDRAVPVKVDISDVLSAADDSHADNEAMEVDPTNDPGLYRVDIVDAAFALGSGAVQVTIIGATIAPSTIEVELESLTAADIQAMQP